MNTTLHISHAGIALQKRYEKGPAKTCPDGYAAQMYFCPAGKPTIGWGHVITDKEVFLRKVTIDLGLADHLLYQDNLVFENAIKKLVQIPLSQTQFDALVCFVFNIGEPNFSTSTLLKKLNAGDIIGAANEFQRWNKFTDPKTGELKVEAGLTLRRQDECALFLGHPHV